jgi:hypothetical protein
MNKCFSHCQDTGGETIGKATLEEIHGRSVVRVSRVEESDQYVRVEDYHSGHSA